MTQAEAQTKAGLRALRKEYKTTYEFIFKATELMEGIISAEPLKGID